MSVTASKTNGRHTAETDVIDGTAVDVYRPAPSPALFRTDDPVEVIEKATRVAQALKHVVAKQGLITRINGKEHPRVEAWQTLGAMLGVFPVKQWVREIPWPDALLTDERKAGLAFGFEASFAAQRPDGAIVGGGESECKRTETKWAKNDDYALRSMAQTRATSKALSGPLRFVMALAGYETTPAEEMPTGSTPSVAGSQSASQPTAAPVKPFDGPDANGKQRSMLHAKAAAAGLTDGQFANAIHVATGGDPTQRVKEDAAKRYISRELARLKARQVDAVIEQIAAAGGQS